MPNPIDRTESATGQPSPAYPMAIPPGHFRLSAEADKMIRQTSFSAEAWEDEAHPVFGLVAAIGGIGIPIGEVFASCGGAIDQGPLLASCVLHFARPLKIGITYQVNGTVESVTRKPSRRFGAADHLRLCIDVRDGDTPYSRLTLTVVMPMGSAA